MKIDLKRLSSAVIICLLIFSLTACNNNNDQFAPGTSVTIAPSSYTWTVMELLDTQGACIFSQNDYQDNVVVITVNDPNGMPIGDMDFQVYLSPSNSTSPPQLDDWHIFYLYDDFNSNGVIDHPEELVSGVGDPILYDTKTEKYHGTKTLIIRTNTSCGGYRATLHTYAGDGYGSMEINTDTEEPDNDEGTEETTERQ
ncbi:MAG: hypothetical protein AAES65_10680 [Candidatus Thiodiazotropha sp. (ex. Lucinoma kazani)]